MQTQQEKMARIATGQEDKEIVGQSDTINAISDRERRIQKQKDREAEGFF